MKCIRNLFHHYLHPTLLLGALPHYPHLNPIVSDVFLKVATKPGGAFPSAGASTDPGVSGLRLWLAGKRSLPHDSESQDYHLDKENYNRKANCIISQRKQLSGFIDRGFG